MPDNSDSQKKETSESSEDIHTPLIPKQTAATVAGAVVGSIAGPIGAVVGGVVGAVAGKAAEKRCLTASSKAVDPQRRETLQTNVERPP